MASSLIGNLAVLLSMDTSAFERGTTQAQRLMRSTQRKFQQMGDSIASAGRAMSLGVTLPLVAFGTHAARAAIDAQELEAAFGETFGNLTGGMRRWAEETGNAMSRSTHELMQGAQTFGLYFNQATAVREEAARMSQQFTVLAQDLASFHNTTVPEALDALRSGLSGETEPLRRYGVFLNEAAVQAKALEMGMVPLNGRLTDQQKIMARAALIMSQTANAQGDVLRTSNSTANQLRAANAAWEELSIAVGTQLLPVLTPLVTKLAELLTWFSQLPAPVQQTVVAVLAVSAAVGPLLIGIGGIVRGIGALLPLITRVGPILASTATGATALTGKLGLMAAALGPIALAATAVYVAFTQWDQITGVADRVNQKLDEMANGSLPRVYTAAETFASAEAFEESFWNTVANEISRIIDSFRQFTTFIATTRDAVMRFHASMFEMATAGAQAVVRMVGQIRDWIVGRLNAIWDQAMERIERIKNAFRDLYVAVVGNSFVPDMVDQIGQHLSRLDQVMVNPAMSATERTAESFSQMASSITSSVRGIISQIKSGDFLGAFEGVLGVIGQFGGLLGGGGGGGLGSAIGLGSKLVSAGGFSFGGFRANGGPVSSGRSYVVGENGPELLSMGSNRGVVFPNNGDGRPSGRIVVELRSEMLKAMIAEGSGFTIAQAYPGMKADIMRQVNEQGRRR